MADDADRLGALGRRRAKAPPQLPGDLADHPVDVVRAEDREPRMLARVDVAAVLDRPPQARRAAVYVEARRQFLGERPAVRPLSDHPHLDVEVRQLGDELVGIEHRPAQIPGRGDAYDRRFARRVEHSPCERPGVVLVMHPARRRAAARRLSHARRRLAICASCRRPARGPGAGDGQRRGAGDPDAPEERAPADDPPPEFVESLGHGRRRAMTMVGHGKVLSEGSGAGGRAP